MNEHEIGQLARAAAAARPADRSEWRVASLRTFLANNNDQGELAGRSYAEVCIALIWVATATETDTPRLLLEAGPWWRALGAAGGRPGSSRWSPPGAGEDECELHPGEWATACRSCAADRLADDQAGGRQRPPGPVPAPRRAEYVSQLRDQVRAVKYTDAPESTEAEAAEAALPADQASSEGLGQPEPSSPPGAVSGALAASGSEEREQESATGAARGG